MAPRGPLVLLIALITLTTGCIGLGSSDEPDDELEPTSREDRVLGHAHLTGGASGGPTRVGTTGAVFEAENGAQAMVLEYTYRTEGRTSELNVALTSPEGKLVHRIQIGPGQEDAVRSGWLVLPGEPGTWTLAGRANGTHSYELNVTSLAPADELVAVPGTGSTERVVVAVVDTGINPYHEVFTSANLSTADLPADIVEADTGEPALSVPVAPSEDYRSSILLDGSIWSQMPGQRLVHFDGTNVLGYHLDDTALPTLPVLDRAGHGTMVANSIVRENPEALVVMVTGNDYDAGVRWAADQPWIDLISLSWGPAVNAAGALEPHLAGFVTPEATRMAHEAGKIVFTATGNDPTLAFTDTTSGPAWVHAVSGAQPDTRARATMSGNLVDTVANWTQTLATYDSLNETRTGSGTSFATPTTAGIAARILHEVRQAGAEAEASELRDALNRTAVYWDTTDYGGPSDPGPSIPVAPGPWASMGWGYLDGSAVPTAVAGLLGEQPLPDKPSEAEAFMGTSLALRQAWWPR